MPTLEIGFLKEAFRRSDLKIFQEKNHLLNYIKNLPKDNCIVLIMSSGNFEGLDFNEVLNTD